MALTFSGTAQHLDLATALVTAAPFSFACWVKIASNPTINGAAISVSNKTADYVFDLYIDTAGKANAGQANLGTNGMATSSSAVSTGSWHHIAAVFTSNASRTVYLDGVGVTNTTNVGTPASVPSVTSIGCFFAGTSTAVDLFPGSIAYPTIWNVALTSTDVTALYNSGTGSDPRTVESTSVVSFSPCLYYDNVSETTWTLTGSPTFVADPFSLKIPTIAQAPVNVNTVGSGTLSGPMTSNTTTGNTLVVIAQGYDATQLVSVSSIAVSTGSASFSKIVAQPGDGAFTYAGCEGWVASNITGGTTPTVTVTYTPTVNLGDVYIYELAGMPSSITTDGTASGNSGTSATPSTSSLTTTGNATIIFASFNPANAMTAGEAGWSTPLIGATTAGLTQYIIESAPQAGIVSSATQSASGAFGAIIFALDGTGSTSGGTDINATGSALPATVLTLATQLALKGVVAFLPATVLSLTAKLTEQAVVGIADAITIGLSGKVLSEAVIAGTSSNTLGLTPDIAGQTLQPPIPITSSVSTTLVSQDKHSAIIFI